jgi:hypothetical protein
LNKDLHKFGLIPVVTLRVSEVMAAFGAYAPRTRYLDRQMASEESGVVKTLCSFLTASGFERELEVPVIIHQGEVLDPAFAMVRGRPVLLSESLIKGISDAGTVLVKPPVRTMFSTAYVDDAEAYKLISESLTPIPKLYRPLY